MNNKFHITLLLSFSLTGHSKLTFLPTNVDTFLYVFVFPSKGSSEPKLIAEILGN